MNIYIYMESSIQQNIYYQNRIKFANAGTYPIYDLYPIEKRVFNQPQKTKKNPRFNIYFYL